MDSVVKPWPASATWRMSPSPVVHHKANVLSGMAALISDALVGPVVPFTSTLVD